MEQTCQDLQRDADPAGAGEKLQGDLEASNGSEVALAFAIDVVQALAIFFLGWAQKEVLTEATSDQK